MERSVTSRKTYFFVYLALLVLLAGTVLATSFNLGIWDTLIALSIAIAKALLVILFFMEVRFNSNLTKIYVVAGFLWLSILISLTLSDYLTRTGGL